MADTRNRPRSLTLEEIGRRAGVSRSTVSRVLNGHPDVRATVRARVERMIKETGYRPNPAARALVSNRSGLLGLVMLTEVDELFGDPYYSELVDGIQRGCTEHGQTFAIFPARGPDERSDMLVPPITQGLVDGVIVTAGPLSDELIIQLRDQGTRMVVVGHPAADEGLMRVDVENREGSATAVRHLLDHGCRRVGFVGATTGYLFGVERLEGYREAISDGGMTPDDRLIRLAEPTEAGGYRATRSVLAEKPDALYVSTDPMAIGAYRAVAELGLRIPEDVAIIGFDGLPRGPRLDPPLSTVVQPVAEVGRTAVALLAGDDDEARTVILPTVLRPGASCDLTGASHHLSEAASTGSAVGGERDTGSR